MSGRGKAPASFRLHWHLRLRCAAPGELGGTQGRRSGGPRGSARGCTWVGGLGSAAWRAGNACARGGYLGGPGGRDGDARG